MNAFDIVVQRIEGSLDIAYAVKRAAICNFCTLVDFDSDFVIDFLGGKIKRVGNSFFYKSTRMRKYVKFTCDYTNTEENTYE